MYLFLLGMLVFLTHGDKYIYSVCVFSAVELICVPWLAYHGAGFHCFARGAVFSTFLHASPGHMEESL